jgi:UDP-2-acetamido-3-amino-2,3-dideoxy-glucuronate N-acetyltransferase
MIDPTAVVEEGASIGEGTRVWRFCHVMAGAVIGKGCVLGQGVFVAAGARIGDGVKIQNNVSVYDGVVIEDDVFLGPSAVLTNVRNPRAAISRRGAFEQTILRRGCTVGANATIVCGVTIGRYAFVGAGAVVTHDVEDHRLVMGVPARVAGWVSRRGCRLDETMRCPESGERYALVDGVLRSQAPE